MGSVLVTGGKGFLGSHICHLIPENELLSPSSSELNLLEFDNVREYLARHSISHIIHAAGFVGGIGLNREHPAKMFSINMRMGLNLLEAVKEHPETTVTIISTICAYPGDAPVPTPENTLHEGYPAAVTAPYGMAKRALHTAAEAFHEEYGNPIRYFIPTNLYGPGDHFEEDRSHVVPALLRRAIEAKEAGASELTVWGDGSPTRDFLYVSDAANGIVNSLKLKPQGVEFLNLGSGSEVSIRELAEIICKVTGFQGKLDWDTSKPGGAPRRALDSTRAWHRIGFQAQTSLEEGLKATLNWFQENREGIR